jgi:hypothetical protein
MVKILDDYGAGGMIAVEVPDSFARLPCSSVI